MTRNKWKILDLSLAAGVFVTGAAVAVKVAVDKNNKEKNLDKVMSSFKFGINENRVDANGNKISIDRSQHYAHEYLFSNYSSGINTSIPYLHHNSEEGKYWDNVLSGYHTDEKDKKDDLKSVDYINRHDDFIFRTNNFEPNNILKNKYRIFYASFANDFEGVLYLRVSLEDINVKDDWGKSSSDARARINDWKHYYYKIDGFKKISEEEISKKTNLNLEPARLDIQEKFRKEMFDKSKNINSVKDIFDKLPQKEIPFSDPKFKENAKADLEKFSNVFSFYSSWLNQSHYKVECSSYNNEIKSNVWFNYDNAKPNELTYYYRVSQVVNAAKMPTADKKDALEDVKEVLVKEIQKDTLNIRYFEFKNMLPKVKIVASSKSKPIGEITIDDLSQYNYNKLETDKHSSEGRYEWLKLIWDGSDAEIKEWDSKYELSYYLKDPNEDRYTDKKDEGNTGYPIVNYPLCSFDKNNGKAKFGIRIREKNARWNSQYYVDFITVSGFKH